MRCPRHDDDFPRPPATNNLASVQADPKGGTCYQCSGCYKYEPAFDNTVGSSTVLCKGCGTDSVIPTSMLDDQDVLSRAGVSHGSELLDVWYDFYFGGLECACQGSPGLQGFFSPTQDNILLHSQCLRDTTALQAEVQHKLRQMLELEGESLMDAICQMDCCMEAIHSHALFGDLRDNFERLEVEVVRAVCSALQDYPPTDDDEVERYINQWFDAYDRVIN